MIYVVINKETGAQVYEYQSDAPVEWSGMEFDTHDHTERLVVNDDGSIEGVIVGRVMTKLDFLRRFTAEERVSIRTVAKTNVQREDYMALLELADEMNTADADTRGGVKMLEGVGLLATGRAQEILNG